MSLSISSGPYILIPPTYSDKFNEHVNNKVCDEVNEDKERICPLCHINIEPEDIWKIHFLSQGCENNPRTKI